MASIINESGGDFQQGGCLYKPTSRHQSTRGCLKGLRNKPQKINQSTFESGIVVIS